MNKFTKSTTVLGTAVIAVTGLGFTQAAHADTAPITIRQTDLIPELADTRSAGHVTFLADGLHVMTDDTTSQAKAAEYFSVTGPLPTSASLTWYGTQPQPGQQIVFDVDDVAGNGNDFNILVGEPTYYGANWWLTNGSSDDAKAVDPSGANNTGNGSAYFGTLAEWKAALPATARVYAGGFSLGSGVKGDGYLGSETYGDTTYTFSANTVADVKAKAHKTVGQHKAKLVFTSKAQPANSTVGKLVTWRVMADGQRIAKIKQGFSETDTIVARFPKHSGKHTVDVYKNGVQVRHFSVRTH